MQFQWTCIYKTSEYYLKKKKKTVTTLINNYATMPIILKCNIKQAVLCNDVIMSFI